MTNTILDPSSNGQAEPSTLPRSAALLLATDGTAQSDAAIELAYLLSLKDQSDVKVLTVVDRAPVPWGSVDVSVVLDYERGQLREAQQRVRAQVERLGNNKWTIEVRNGNPTTTIADLAKETGARLLVVGLGGHGPAARFFGNETALRLMRVSRTPSWRSTELCGLFQVASSSRWTSVNRASKQRDSHSTSPRLERR